MGDVIPKGQQGVLTLGDKLIGLKKASDAGALTERESITNRRQNLSIKNDTLLVATLGKLVQQRECR